RGPATNTAWFDAALTNPRIGSNRTLRLGPGTFQTAGIDVNGVGWAPKSGWRFMGSGINATTVRLYNPNAGSRCAIGLPSNPVTALSGFEASDFLLDCGY